MSVNRTSWILFALVLIGLMVGIGYLIHLKLGIEDLSAWGAYLEGCATIIISITAIVAAVQGLSEYREKVATESAAAERDKAKWLFQLYEKLFEKGQYKNVRRRIDYGNTEEIKRLIAKDKANEQFDESEKTNFDEFTDYLNFFEMVAHLKVVGQLTSRDVRATFDYYLNLLTKHENPEIREYLKKKGFESLDKLLLEYES